SPPLVIDLARSASGAAPPGGGAPSRGSRPWAAECVAGSLTGDAAGSLALPRRLLAGARRIEVLSVSLAGADRPEGGAGRIAEADCAGTPPGAHSASETTLALARWGATVHHPRVLERLPTSGAQLARRRGANSGDFRAH